MAENLDLQSLLRPRRIAMGGVTTPTPEREIVPDVASLEQLTDRCEVLRELLLPDGTGGQMATWTQAGSYPCLVIPAGATREGMDGVQAESTAPYSVKLPATAQIFPSDRLGIPGWFNARESGAEYSKGDRVLPSGSDATHLLIAVEGGITAAGAPAKLPAQEGEEARDGEVLWGYGGRVNFLEVVGTDNARSNSFQLVVMAKEVV